MSNKDVGSLVAALLADLRTIASPAELYSSIGITPDEWQSRILRSEARRILCLCGRQTGKSLVGALAALETALLEPGSLTLIMSGSQRQSGELQRTISRAFRQLPDQPTPTGESILRIELVNGSRVIALPATGDSSRGFSACKLLILDECAFLSDSVISAVTPSLATVKDSRILALSTPNGRQGWFFNQWSAQGQIKDPWERYQLRSDDCPRIDPAFLEAEKQALGRLYSQEYLCEFLDPGSSIFSAEMIDACFGGEAQAYWQ